MKTVFLLRHAKSSWKHPELADHDRPLNKRGKRDAPRMARLLAQQGVAPDRIVSSTAERARRTAEALAEELELAAPIELSPDLYRGDAAEYCRLLREVPDECETVVLVGHNPVLEILLEQWTNRCERFPTAALAQVSLDATSWTELDLDTKGVLVALWRPRELA